jgi:hypothetical protein
MKLNKFHLHTDVRNQSTFYHHDGKSKSQIDYIISNDDVIESITWLSEFAIFAGKYTLIRQIGLFLVCISAAIILSFPSVNFLMYLSLSLGNSHDAKLKSFMKLNEFHLHTDVRNQSTFYHHDGKSKSQIDYIIANDDVIAF